MFHLSAPEFLKSTWKKSPQIISFEPQEWITPDELAGLACEPEADSRIIWNKEKQWFLESGPFLESRFSTLPEKDWTLLVQNVDRSVPALARLWDQFRFIPNWQHDDMMLSFAAPGGSVGAHLDQFDVFLAQLQGRRRWQVETVPRKMPEVDSKQPLPVLKLFSPDLDRVLEPGEALYLPPRRPHWGVAEDACLTLSIGFRFPSPEEWESCFGQNISFQSPAPHDGWGGEITDSVFQYFEKESGQSGLEFRRALGKLLTEPRQAATAPEALFDQRDFAQQLEECGRVQQNGGSHFCYAESMGLLFVDGTEVPFQSYELGGIQHLCDHWESKREDVDAVSTGTLLKLVNRGVLVLPAD